MTFFVSKICWVDVEQNNNIIIYDLCCYSFNWAAVKWFINNFPTCRLKIVIGITYEVEVSLKGASVDWAIWFVCLFDMTPEQPSLILFRLFLVISANDWSHVQITLLNVIMFFSWCNFGVRLHRHPLEHWHM